MALPTARLLLGSHGSPICCRSLLLLFLSLGWMPHLQIQATKTDQVRCPGGHRRIFSSWGYA
ncbi:hypothetical protein A6R68_23329, partial [Neotoma lepida]